MKNVISILKYIVPAIILLICAVAGHFTQDVNKYYSKDEVSAFSSAAETGKSGMIIAMGGGFDTQDRFQVLIEKSIAHTGKATPKMLFLPTANLDLMHERELIMEWFEQSGCECDYLLASKADSDEIKNKIKNADIIYATGGSLKFLSETWSQSGVTEEVRKAFERGAVLMGRSSGAMCWAQRGWDDCGEEVFRIIEDFPFLGKDSAYEFFDCAGILPFCICPHFDNIAWRTYAFEAKDLDIPSICIENGAAVIYCNGNYSVISDSKTPFKTAYLFVPDRNIYMLDIKQNSEFVKLADGECKN